MRRLRIAYAPMRTLIVAAVFDRSSLLFLRGVRGMLLQLRATDLLATRIEHRFWSLANAHPARAAVLRFGRIVHTECAATSVCHMCIIAARRYYTSVRALLPLRTTVNRISTLCVLPMFAWTVAAVRTSRTMCAGSVV